MVNWKSTAFVSSAGALATWLASMASPAPTQAQKVVAPAAPQPATEIIELADRLERRLEGHAFERPTRNLFQFEARASRPTVPAAEVAAVPVAPVPAAPPVALAGVAMDLVDGQEVWTGVFSTPTGVVLAKVGESVSGLAVSTLGADSATLTRPDGTTLSLPLSGRQP